MHTEAFSALSIVALTSFSLKLASNPLSTSFSLFVLHNIGLVIAEKLCNANGNSIFPFTSIALTSFSLECLLKWLKYLFLLCVLDNLSLLSPIEAIFCSFYSLH